MASRKNTRTSKPKPKAHESKKAEKSGVQAAPGYKGHKAGRRKGKVHELFDKQGPEAAWTLGLKLGLKENTLRSWFGVWGRGKTKGKPAPRWKLTQKPTASITAKADAGKPVSETAPA